MQNNFYADNLEEFARQVVWYMEPQDALKDKNSFLLHLMAKTTRNAYEHVRKNFLYTDEDFIEALRNAKPGVFIYEDDWLKWNAIFGINPPLPFPRKWQ